MSSGVVIDSECGLRYEELKIKHKYLYIIFKLSNDKRTITVEKAAERPSSLSSYEEEYNKFNEDLPDEDSRWAVYDFEFEKEGAGKRNKLTFISWFVFLVEYNLWTS
jgi:cofilin